MMSFGSAAPGSRSQELGFACAAARGGASGHDARSARKYARVIKEMGIANE